MLLNELLRISTNFIWKNPDKVRLYEGNVDSIEVEQYLLAVQGNLTFDLIHKFDEEVFLAMGIDEQIATEYANNQYSIPLDIRDACTKNQISYILENYEERNNYYRMLSGLPDLEDDTFLYNKDYPDISDDITPIHLLDTSQLYTLEALGYFDKLLEQYPDKKYLMHLTSKRIDVYTARQSEDYSILWITGSGYGSLISEFKDMYNLNRQMVLNVYYTRSMNKNNENYGGFIGLVILFSTLIHMNQKFLDTDITRDFFDEESLKYVYDSYGVPFYSSIPMEFHKKIVKNINILISHKGSTRVFYDLFDIFGFNSTGIFEYYLLKTHKFDEDGKPIFVKNEDGSYDYKSMYDVKFSKVLLYNDPSTEIKDSRNHIEYERIVANDPYWITDKELIDKLYEEEYNYIESKYLGVQTTFNLMKILYETTYYLKMIIDNRTLLQATVIYNSNINANCNLFDLVIYTCALVCHKYGYTGNIPSNPHEIGKLMGFNFKEDLVVLKKSISENKYLKEDSTLLSYLETMQVDSLDSIKKVFSNFTALKKYLTNKMADTDIADEYWAYYELYKTMMYSEYVDGVFVRTDGVPAETFLDLLKDINLPLYNRLMNNDDLDMSSELSDTLYLLKNSCDQLENLEYADSVNIDSILVYLFKLLDFFKSAKADLVGYEVVYSLIDNGENIMKLMNMITYIFDNHTLDPQYSIIDELDEVICFINDKMTLVSKLESLLGEIVLEESKTQVTDLIDYLTDEIKTISQIIYLTSNKVMMYDVIDDTTEAFLLEPDKLPFRDAVGILHDNLKAFIQYVLSDEGLMLSSKIFRISDFVFTNDATSIDKMMFETRLIDVTRSRPIRGTFTMGDDSIRNIVEISIESDEFKLLFLDVLKEAVESYGISHDMYVGDIMQSIYQTIHNVKAGIGFVDSMYVYHHALLHSLLINNMGYFNDYIKSVCMRHFINEHCLLTDVILSNMEKVPRVKDDCYLYEDIRKEKDDSTVYSNTRFSDKLVLKYERFEE